MTREEYIKKLIAFNSTEKYQDEMAMMKLLLNPQLSEKILDYGCGIGFMVRYLNMDIKCSCFGYDVNNYRLEDNDFLFRNEYHFPFDKIYFMHSLAHIPDPIRILEKLKETFLKEKGAVHVITPNKAWLDSFKNPDYIPDPTVKEHFTMSSLMQLFVDAGYKIKKVGQFSFSPGHIWDGDCERLFLSATL